jgi:hypothetical protein
MELMKNSHSSFQATYKVAWDLEVIQKENKPPKPITVAVIAPKLTPLTLEELWKAEAVNAVQARQGPTPQTGGPNQNGNSNRNITENIQCRYCKIFWAHAA